AEGAEVAAGVAPLDDLREARIERQQILERAVLGAGLADEDLAALLDDVGLDLADVTVDEVGERPLAAQDRVPGLDDAARAQRVRRARPAEGRARALVALEQRTRRPLRRRRRALGQALIDRLEGAPADLRERPHDRLQLGVHPISLCQLGGATTRW